MKILFILPRPLFPCDTGGRIRTHRIVQCLVKKAEVHALSLAAPETAGEPQEKMARLFASYTPVLWKEAARFSVSFYLQFAQNWFDANPFFISKYVSSDLEKKARELHEKHRFDILLCDFPQAGTSFLGSSLRPRVLFQHNVEHRIRKQHFQAERNPLVRWVLRREWEKTFAVEGQVCRDMDHVITVSEEDRLAHDVDFGIRHVSSIPTGVDADYFSPSDLPELPGHITFVASYDWFPNEDAALWLMSEIFPRVRAALPGTTLSLVGRLPTVAMKNKAAHSPGVEVTGRVDDVRPYLSRAEVVVVPIRIGGGTRIKIFEAMAMNKAVISTTIGAEGLPVQSGENIILADGADRFAENVIALLKNAGERQRIAAAARQMVVKNHTWDVVAQRMEEILRAVAHLKPEGPSIPKPVGLSTALAE